MVPIKKLKTFIKKRSRVTIFVILLQIVSVKVVAQQQDSDILKTKWLSSLVQWSFSTLDNNSIDSVDALVDSLGNLYENKKKYQEIRTIVQSLKFDFRKLKLQQSLLTQLKNSIPDNIAEANFDILSSLRDSIHSIVNGLPYPSKSEAENVINRMEDNQEAIMDYESLKPLLIEWSKDMNQQVDKMEGAIHSYVQTNRLLNIRLAEYHGNRRQEYSQNELEIQQKISEVRDEIDSNIQEIMRFKN